MGSRVKLVSPTQNWPHGPDVVGDLVDHSAQVGSR